MTQFSANISTLFTERPFLERFSAARAAGFEAVECWFPYDHSIDELNRAIEKASVKLVGLNTPPGSDGEWGLAALPGRGDHFRDGVDRAIQYATHLRVPAVHVLAGIPKPGESQAAAAAYRKNLRYAHDIAATNGIAILIEPLNSRDRPGYFLSDTQQAAEIIGGLDLPNLRLLFDCYHVQIQEGNITERLRRLFPMIGHVQIAAVPDRGEPDTGEISYPFILSELRHLGWDGWIGAEYNPRRGTKEGLGWLKSLADPQ